MSRRLWTLALTALIIALAPSAAGAHPLGNFSTNHLAIVEISADRVDVDYILDQAEIPTFQERGLSDATVLARKRDEVQRRLKLIVDGERVALNVKRGASITHPPGQGGLTLTRVQLSLTAPLEDPRNVEIQDGTFPGRVGWKAIVSRPGEGTAVRASAPSGDPTNGLRSYPEGMLASPIDQRSARFSVRPGSGTLIAPKAVGGTPQKTKSRSGDGFAAVFSDAAAGKGALLFLLLAAFGWGALHALSPGHGKAMVAAYLVGTAGKPRDAVMLGAIVTVTHTIGVFALGLVTLLLSRYVLPEDLYPWLNLVAGLMVVVIGATVLRGRVRAARARRDHAHDNGHTHDHGHTPDHGHAHDHGEAHGHGDAHDHGHTRDHHHKGHGHGHRHHHHDIPDRLTGRGLLGMGAAAGLLPCPSALVVLLAAIAQQQIALGMLLIVIFSVGLAMTLTVLGIAVIHAGNFTTRFDASGRVAVALPALSAVVILGAGVLLTIRALPQLAA